MKNDVLCKSELSKRMVVHTSETVVLRVRGLEDGSGIARGMRI